MLRKYEMMVIFHPQLADDVLTEAIDGIQGLITSGGGEVTEAIRESPWGRRRLAYTIRHGGQDLRDGYYVLFYFNGAPRSIAPMERTLHLNDRVIRHLVVKVDEKAIARMERSQARTETRMAAKAARQAEAQR